LMRRVDSDREADAKQLMEKNRELKEEVESLECALKVS
jgi:hypothetical protein